MNTCFDFPAPASVKKIVFMSSPPISDTNRTSGWRRSTHAATATTSWTYLPPIRAVMEPAPEPVTKTRSTPGREAGLGLHALEELEHLLGLAGVVPLVVAPDDAVAVDQRRLDGGRADVEARDLHDATARGASARDPFDARVARQGGEAVTRGP